MWLNEMRSKQEPQIMVKEVVPVIREKFPKYDAQLHSKIERPEQYGIELCKEATEAVCAHFNYQPPSTTKRRRKDNRTLPRRIQGRLSEDEYGRLQTALREDGYADVQDWLRHIVIRYLNRRERTKHPNQIHM